MIPCCDAFSKLKVSSDELRLHKEKTIEGVKHFQATDRRFLDASDNDKYLWNFHSHHEVTYPSCDSDFELWTQIAIPLALPTAATMMSYYFDFMPRWFTRSFSIALAIGSFTQKTHFWAHARNHNDLHGVFGAVITGLQDCGMIVHPDLHRKHHEEFDCNFCILNGWGNPVINRMRIFLTVINAYGDQAPTTITRIEREQRANSTTPISPIEPGKKDCGINIGLLWATLIGVIFFGVAFVMNHI